MPVFEYVCKDCGKRSEILVKSSDEAVTCSCGSKNLKKLFSSFAVSQAGTTGHSCSSCADGSCNLPSSPCASGMCGL